MVEEGLEARLGRFVGVEAEPPRVARYAVNGAMIRNWVEAHDDGNPIYVDREVARATGRRDVVCPPAMISTWVMAGYRRHREVQRLRATGATEDFAYSRLMNLLDKAGYTSVVATNVEQEYLRELHPGDQVTAHFTIESVSAEKKTALGRGFFITLRKKYVDRDENPVAEERFRLLRFAPS
ncbi:FAS1-like dehydratase domain-containing protein [Amycolatopsis taiwanensis]|uniref:FAS1-like dehydratase domain-containing protein n=1 Tax=Amycolatopsis taiwanensis TaxID=342230 RepID=UPI00047FF2AB|nr:MaoC family dehydratase N-terminal domain-containing protein [Amycolatopsis taiwanensis]